MFRGSRKHVLDWTGRPNFCEELLRMVAPVECRVSSSARWMPEGYASPEEARLETFGPQSLPGRIAWTDVSTWWLAHKRGANTPNWDIALACEIEGKAGLILVEAKAHAWELSIDGKTRRPDASPNSVANHERIGLAIAEARAALSRQGITNSISRDSHYQLSNRLAFTWKLASLGLPVVLVYLGFIGDSGIKDVGAPFSDAAEWRSVFLAHADPILPVSAFEQRIDCGLAPAWFLVRSRQVAEISPPGLDD